MAEGTVRIKGLRELNRALDKVNREAGRTVKKALGEAAKPIAATAQAKLSRYPGANVKAIAPRVGVAGVFVTDRARKVSGLRPDFGRLIMTHGLEPALAEHADDTVKEVERALDKLGHSAGF